jgi:hypothetical protein
MLPPAKGVRAAGVAADAGRAAEAAADVARGAGAAAATRGADIADDVASQFRANTFDYTADRRLLDRVPDYQKDTVEILNRQGFDAPPSFVPRERFAELEQSGEFIPIYRGVRDYEGIPAQSFVDEFAEGDFFVGGGALGNGAYFTTSRSVAQGYGPSGEVIEALVPRNARIFDLDDPASASVLAERQASPFRDTADFLAAKGYDGLKSGDNIVLYNRSAVTVPSGSGRAADVGRVEDLGISRQAAVSVDRSVPNAGRAADISSEVGRRIVRNPNPRYTLPQDELARVPEGRKVTAEIFHRQGFDKLPTAVPRLQFDDIANSGEYIVLYRGIRGGQGSTGSASVGRGFEVVDAGDAAKEFISGRLYYGGGAGPDGSYFATSENVAKDYAVGVNSLMASSEPGAVVAAALPRNAKIASYEDPALLAEFSNSGFPNLGAFAAAKGYDAIVTKEGIHIVLNRSALIVEQAPRMYTFGK